MLEEYMFHLIPFQNVIKYWVYKYVMQLVKSILPCPSLNSLFAHMECSSCLYPLCYAVDITLLFVQIDFLSLEIGQRKMVLPLT